MNTYQNYASPTKIASNVDKIGIAWASSYFTKQNETGLYSFGCNLNGELGRNIKDRNTFDIGKVQDADGKEINQKVIKIGNNTTNALSYLTDNGTPYGAGWNGGKHLGKVEEEMYYYAMPINSIDPIRLDRMLIGETLNLNITRDDLVGENNLFNLKESNITYEIYPEYTHIATIDNNGVVTGISKGRAKGKITDTANNLSIDLVIDVEKNYAKVVRNAYGNYELDIEGNVYFWGKDYCGVSGNGLSPVTTYADAKRYYTSPIRVKNANDETGYLTNIVDLVSTTKSVLALDKDGNVWSWGHNGYGQLGIGNTTTYSTAKQVLTAANQPLTGIVKLETLRYSSMAIAKDGSVYTWGKAEEGGLLNGKYATNVTYATRVKSIDKVIEVDSTGWSAMVGLLRSTGTVWTAGHLEQTDNSESYGENGKPSPLSPKITLDNFAIPQRVEEIDNVEKLVTGYASAVVIKKDKTVWTWGRYNFYEGEQGAETLTESVYITKPVQVQGITNAKEISLASSSYSVIIENDNKIYTWGSNTWGECGIGNISTKVGNITSTGVSNLGVVKTITGKDFDASRIDHISINAIDSITYVVLDDGCIYAYGYNGPDNTDAMNFQTREEYAYPYATYIGRRYLSLEQKYERIQVGESITVKGGVIDEQNLYGYDVVVGQYELKSDDESIAQVQGRNIIGVGIGSTVVTVFDPITEQEAIVKVEVRNQNAVALPQVEMGECYTVALREDGTVWTSGLNKTSQLGLGWSGGNMYEQAQVLTQVEDDYGTVLDTPLSNIVKISAGFNHVLALTKDGEVYAWGANNYGQLGINSKVNSNYAVKVLNTDASDNLKNIIDISAGTDLSTFLDKDGYVLTCGYSRNGQLGTGTTSNTVIQMLPTYIDIDNVVEITTGGQTVGTQNAYTMALQADKKLFGWGFNSHGQLGNGTTTSVLSPEKVYEGAIKVKTAGRTTLIKYENGKYLIVGDNEDGEFDLPEITNTTKFKELNVNLENGNKIDVKDVYLNPWGTTIIDKQGFAYARGWNAFGNLARHDNNDHYYNWDLMKKKDGTPISNVFRIGRGGTDYNNSLITKDGTVWITGDNSEGQIGDRTYDSTNYLTPFGVGYINLDKRNITIKIDQNTPVNLLESQPNFSVFEKDKRFEFEWTSVDSEIATVSQAGIITGKNIGQTMITVTEKNTGISSSIIVSVTSNHEDSIAMPQVENLEDATIVLKADGTVWTTGLNNFGQLGNGTTTKRNYYDRVKISKTAYLENVVKISAGANGCLALTKDGEVYAWGRNQYGQLGLASNTSYLAYATKVKGVNNKGSLNNIIDISMGYFNAVAVDKDGNVITWGWNKTGELGLGNVKQYKYPVYSSIGNAISAEAGYYTLTILRDNKDLYQAGDYRYIGVKGATENVTIPTKVLGNVTQYSEPVYNTIAKTGDGKIYAWGQNYQKYLPFEATIKDDDEGNWHADEPKELTLPVDEAGNKVDVKYVKSSDNSLYMLAKDGTAYSVGYNDFGTLSNGTIQYETEFKPMLNSKNEPFKNISMLGKGKYHTQSVITKDGYVYTSGNNTSGEFGNSTYDSVNYLTMAGTAFLDFEDSKQITIKVNEEYGINKEKFYINGDFNVFPELNGLPGDITLELEETDKVSLDDSGKVTGLNQGTAKVKVTEGISNLETYLTFRVTDKKVQIKQGNYFTISLKENGTVWTWGYNGYGQLGIGNKTTKKVPVQAVNINNVKDIGAGTNHAIALKEDGTVWTWGYNYYGQIGTGDTSVRLVPTQVVGLRDIVEVEAYGNTSYAIDVRGDVYVWGYGYSKKPQKRNIGERVVSCDRDLLITQSKCIYDLSTKKYNWSVQDAIQVAKGTNHYLALNPDGTVYAWGNNRYGQLGRGWASNTNYGVDYVYADESGEPLKDIVAIKAGNYSSVAVDKNGKVYTWGYNGYYQLADGTKTNRTLPVQNDRLENIENVSQSYSNCTMAYDYDGYVYSAGYGGNWQLGTNTNKNQSRFKMIGSVELASDTDRVSVEVGEEKDLNLKLSNTFNLKTDVASTENIDVTIVDEEVGQLNGGKIVGVKQGKTLAVARHKSSSIYKYIQIDVVAKDSFTAPKIENGRDFSVALRADGTIWTWGRNQYGQLGLGNNNDYSEPQKVTVIDPDTKEEQKIIDISVGEYHVIALAENGITYTWGKSDLYQTGHANRTAFKKPTKMYDSYGNECCGIVKVVAEKDSTYVIDIYGGIYACGKWWSGKIKDNVSPIDAAVDVNNEYVLDVDGKVYNWQDEIAIDEPIKAINEGTSHSTFLSKTGKVYSIGTNTYGELGNGTKTDLTTKVAQVKTDENTLLENIVEIKSGDYYNVAISKDGKLYTWGINENDKQGRDDYSYSLYAKENEKIQNVLTASSGYNHTTYADNQGIVYAVGKGDYGQLGNRQTNNYSTPVVVGDYLINLSTNHIQIAVDESAQLEGNVKNFNIIYDQEGKITYTNHDTGIIKATSAKQNVNGNYETLVTGRKIGTTSITASTKNGEVVGVIQVEVIPENTEIKPQISVGGSHTISLRANGTVWTWGQNNYGQLGTNDTVARDNPVQVQFDGNVRIKMVSAGKDYSLALDTDGNVWGWGRNTYYEIDQVSQTKVLKPRKFSKVGNIIKITAGINTSVLLAEDGSIYTYGLNSDGQAGTGDYTARVANKANYDMQNVIDISAGAAHVMALKSDGTVWVTGSNRYGQLGINDKFVSQVARYQKVELPETIAYIHSGENSCFAISNTGKVYAWGANYYGQLGLKDKENRYTPEQVEELSNIREISSGINHTIARDGNGFIYVTGTNKQGELGIGNNDAKVIFERVNSISGIMDISAGENYTVVALKDGSAWAWGDYNHGDENLKSKTKSTVPVKIGSDNVSLKELEVTLKVNEQKLLDIAGEFVFNLIYDTKSSSDFTYESLNNDIVTVDRDGNIRGMREGTTWVIARDIENKRELVAIVKVIGNENIIAPKVEAGNNFAASLKADGSVWTWGYNGQGELGNAKMETSRIPTKTAMEGVYKDIKSGESFTLALKDDGTVWGFGSNSKGQLASTNISYNNIPMQINGLTDIEQIAAGKDYGLALDSYGVLYGWGENSSGQLGQDNIGEYTYNVARVVISTERIMHIAAGNKQSAIVDSSGKVYGFGEYLNGYLDGIENAVKTEIGNGYMLILTTEGKLYQYDKTGLKQISTNSNVIDISVQNTQNMYQTKDEKVYVWGNSIATIPTLLTNANTSNVFGIGAGYNNTYIISNEGYIYASGVNNLGQLGNTTQNDETDYVLVGDTQFKVEPESGVMHIGDEEEIKITAELFNVFKETTKDLENFELTSDNESVVNANIDTSESTPKAMLNATSVGTANITIKDKQTNLEQTIIRVVEPIEQDRIDFIKVNDITAKVVGEKKYEVTIPTDGETASVEVQTKDKTDAIDVGKSGIFAPNGNVTKIVDVNDRETVVQIDVKATNGEVVPFELKIIKQSVNNELETIKVDGITIAPNVNGVYQLIVQDKDSYEIYAKAKSEYAQVNIDAIKYDPREQTKDVAFRDETEMIRQVAINIKAESGDIKTYTLELYKKDAEEIRYLEKVMVNGDQAYKIAENKYYAIIKDTDNEAQIEAYAKFYKSSVDIENNGYKIAYNTYTKQISDLETEITITVKDETGKTKVYTLVIVKETIAKQELQLEFVRVNGVHAEISKDNDRIYEITLDKPINMASIEAGTVLDDANVSINGGKYKEKVSIENITIVGSYMQIPIIAQREDITTVYYLNIYGLPDEADLKNVSLRDVGNATYNPVTGEYEISVTKDITDYIVEVEPADEKASTKIEDDEYTIGNSIKTIVKENGETITIVKIMCKSQNGLVEKEHTLKIREKSSNTNLEGVLINSEEATYDEELGMYYKEVKGDIEIAKIQAILADGNATVSIEDVEENPHDTAINDREKIITIKVTAEDGSVQEHKLKIVKLSNNTENTVEAGQTEDTLSVITPDAEGNYYIKVPRIDTYVIKVTAPSDATLAINGNNETTGTETISLEEDVTMVEFTVVAEDGTEVSQTITIEKESENKEIASITGENILSTKLAGENTYEIKLDDRVTEQFEIKIETKHDLASAKLTTEEETSYEVKTITRMINLADCIGTDEEGNEILTFQVDVKAEDGSELTYTIIINKVHNLELDKVEVNGIQADKQDKIYNVVIPRTNDENIKIVANNKDVIITVYEDGMSIGEDKGEVNINVSLLDEQKTYMIIVKDPEDETRTEVYTLNVRKKSNKTELEKVIVDDKEVQKDENGIYKVSVKDLESHKLQLTSSTYSQIKVDTDNYSDTNEVTKNYNINVCDTKQIAVRVKAEDGTESEEYIIQIYVMDNDKTFELKVDNIPITNYDNTTKTYTTYVDNQNTQAIVQMIANSSKAIVTIDEETDNANQIIRTKALQGQGKATTIKLQIVSEDGEKEERYLKIIQLPNNVMLDKESAITVNDIAATKVDDKNYEVTISDKTGKAEIVIKAFEQTSYIIIDNDITHQTQGIKTEEREVQNDDILTVDIRIMSEDGESYNDYKLTINVISSNTELFEITVDDEEVEKIDKNNYRYFISEKATDATVHIEAKEETSKISYEGNSYEQVMDKVINLNDEVTEVKFKIIAEDKTEEEYTLYIYKISVDNSLLKLWVDDVEITSEDGINYRARVLDQLSTVKIKAQTTNEFATVKIGNGLTKVNISEQDQTLAEAKETKVNIEVIAQNGDIRNITLVIEKISDNANMDKILVNKNEPIYEASQDRYYAKVSDSLENHEVYIKAENDKATITINGETGTGDITTLVTFNLNEDAKLLPYTITSEAGTVTNGKLLIVKSSTQTGLKEVMVNEQKVEPTTIDTGTVYIKTIPDNALSANIKVKTINDYAKIKIGNKEESYGEALAKIEFTLDQLEITVPVVVTATDGTTTETFNVILRRESYKPETGVKGVIHTENAYSLHNAKISIYKSQETPNNSTVGTELVGEFVTNDDGTYKATIYKAPINKSSINDKNNNEIADELECKYDVVISKDGYLSYTILGIELTAGEYIDLGEYNLIAGDVVATGEIEIDDLVAINDSFGQITDDNRAKKAKFDFNGDDLINDIDIDILKANYGKTAEKITWVNPKAKKKTIEKKSSKKVISKTNEKQDFIVPMNCAYSITSEYGTRTHPVTKVVKKHTGIDLGGTWHTEILAVADGEVTFAGVQNGFGNCVEIKHVVNGETIYSFYAHLSKIDVNKGDKVTQGTVIGLEGGNPDVDPNPGNSTGHHLHFEIRNASGYGNDIDPCNYIKF